jgi:hypothetical protein
LSVFLVRPNGAFGTARTSPDMPSASPRASM